MGKTRLLSIWTSMKTRCNNPNSDNYDRYGGRGIFVCDEWKSFEPFKEWALKNGYKDGLQIDRRDTDGNYEPGNCRWVTPKENSNNKSNNKFYTIGGVTKTYSQWAEEIGISKSTFKQRLDHGWKPEEMFSEQRKRECVRKYTGETLTINGITKSQSEWADIIGISRATLWDRVEQNWSDDELLMPKGYRRKKEMVVRNNTSLVEIEGISKPISEWCKLIGINKTSFRRRIDRGIEGKYLLLPSRYSSRDEEKLINEVTKLLELLKYDK